MKESDRRTHGDSPRAFSLFTEPHKEICKVALTIKEAAEYSNIGINKLECLLRSPRCPFVLYVGKKKLVKRKEFEKFISDNIEI